MAEPVTGRVPGTTGTTAEGGLVKAAEGGPVETVEAGPVWKPAGTVRSSARTLRVRVSAAIVLLIALAVLLVPPLAQLDQQAVDLSAKLLPPSWAHPFGTDDVGRDLLLRCVYGLRVSLLVGLVAALVATVLGTAVGAAAGALGGWTDRLVMRAVDTLSSIPHLLLGIFIVAMFRPGVWPVVVSVAVTHWLSTARIVRAEVLSLRGRPYVDAAISGGASRWRVALRHLVPGVLPQAGLAAVLMVPHAMWHESALSFLGLGLPAHQASLGNLVQSARGSLLAGDWWPTLFPGLLLIIPTLAIAGLAGAWRDRLNPRRRSELSL
ncbi:ABC transporter permease [Streptomyces antarcticus]|uniref:ABC transporter permease n=1 Tax=Streptomyces antarcticus TaxID=2996458 RepID=UPI00226FF145|nr:MULTISPECIES: ABC transporter permease [unclassified Streptomyces]MCY0941492.1 ABC transporter permease [Streptomyces sp. H34-AA3]MCZ4084899.1 ABC transporter permease [Streptomyces sp. H34-S5]